MTSLAICTAASGQNHQSCLPLFALSLRESYPEYALRLFSVGELDASVKAALEAVGGRDVVLDEREFLGYCAQPRLGARVRWLVFTRARWAKFFVGFDGVYITDCDLFITREEPPLHIQHVRHCQTLGLPYSNMIRSCRHRMTGLLFCTPAFAEQIAQTCERFDVNVRTKGWQKLGNPGRTDEWMLREMVEQAGIGLPPYHRPEDDPTNGIAMGNPLNYEQVWFRPWHGINLGWADQAGGLGYAKQALRDQPEVMVAMEHLVRLREHPDFQITYAVLAPHFQAAFDTWQEAYDQVRSER